MKNKMKREIRVWDPLVRIFHWGLVLAFGIAYFSGDEENNLHLVAGYVVFGLIGFRILWGLIGTRFARFSNFVYSPASVIKYIKDSVAGRPKHYIGHNPAGGVMIIALLLSLVGVTYSGLKVYAIEEGAGPLAQQNTEISFIKSAYADSDKHGKNEEHEEEEFWEEIHEASANFVLFLVILHIAGVFIAGRLHDENLVKGMITGKKRVE
ncbi:MAG: cytochrome B [Gammaproteobacteria bacterium]|nr:MAG: cytochrome B [Gammaproteobacteria bacterium]